MIAIENVINSKPNFSWVRSDISDVIDTSVFLELGGDVEDAVQFKSYDFTKVIAIRNLPKDVLADAVDESERFIYRYIAAQSNNTILDGPVAIELPGKDLVMAYIDKSNFEESVDENDTCSPDGVE